MYFANRFDNKRAERSYFITKNRQTNDYSETYHLLITTISLLVNNTCFWKIDRLIIWNKKGGEIIESEDSFIQISTG